MGWDHSLILPFFGVKEVHYTSLSGSRVLSSRHFPSGLREKHFANVGKKHVSIVSRPILNYRQSKNKKKTHIIRKLVLAFASKDFPK